MQSIFVAATTTFVTTLVIGWTTLLSPRLSLGMDRPKTSSQSQAAKPRSKAEAEADLLIQQLASPDIEIQNAAVARVNAILDTPSELDEKGEPVSKKALVHPRWLDSLLKVKRYDDVISIATRGMLLWPANSDRISGFQKVRVWALIASGKTDAALSASKTYYNVCTMKETASAIELVAACLRKAHPQEPAIAKTFSAQQVAGATTQPTTMPAAAALNILKTIPVDSSPFEGALKEFVFEDFSAMVGKGNVLLLCDRPKEAMECFEAAMVQAVNEAGLKVAVEGVARAIRAETGAIGPANNFILTQRKPPAKPEL